MFFSVILPVYNVEKYLHACVDSLLGQTFTDFEVLLVNDGSKDGSGRICDEYAEKDTRVKAIHKPNGGQSSARNMGFDHASGEYIVYIDSDDFITSDSFLADLHAKILETGSDIVLYKHAKFYDSTGKMDDCTYSLSLTDESDTDGSLLELVKRDAYFGMAWIKTFRRELAVAGNVKFDTSLSCEDMDWYFNLLSTATGISAIDKSYVAYRQREGSVTATVKLKNLVDFIITLENWGNKIRNGQMSDKKKAALMGALAKYYSNLLITYTRLADKNKKQYARRIKALSYLLDYSLSARPLQIKKYYKMVGFGGVVLMLKIYDKIK